MKQRKLTSIKECGTTARRMNTFRKITVGGNATRAKVRISCVARKMKTLKTN